MLASTTKPHSVTPLRAFVGRVSGGEKYYAPKEPAFEQAKRNLIDVYTRFAHTSTPPLIKPEHASLLRDIWETMDRGRLYETQRQTLSRILAELGQGR